MKSCVSLTILKIVQTFPEDIQRKKTIVPQVHVHSTTKRSEKFQDYATVPTTFEKPVSCHDVTNSNQQDNCKEARGQAMIPHHENQTWVLENVPSEKRQFRANESIAKTKY